MIEDGWEPAVRLNIEIDLAVLYCIHIKRMKIPTKDILIKPSKGMWVMLSTKSVRRPVRRPLLISCSLPTVNSFLLPMHCGRV